MKMVLIESNSPFLPEPAERTRTMQQALLLVQNWCEKALSSQGLAESKTSL